MTDRPIIFSGPMVRALLEGSKTQTRRIIKPPKSRPSLFDGEWKDSFILDPANADWLQQDVRYEVGDKLYVRENFHLGIGYDGAKPSDAAPLACVWYAADNTTWMGMGKCRPSIHMPRWASRLTLVVTEVRVQRLLDMSEDDAIAEGIEPLQGGAVCEFRNLWDSLNAKRGYGWQTDPWVVAIAFAVHHCNIDQMKEAA